MSAILTGIGPIGARQINRNLYVGHNDLITIQAAVTAAARAGGIFTVYIPPEYAGTDEPATVTGGSLSINLMDERDGQRQGYTWNGTHYVPSDFEPLGVIRADLITANEIEASDATFDTATVDDSPVRTFANTPDGPGQGMVWPTIGIPVSLGSTWQNPSIDPASLAIWPATGIPVSTGAAWGASIPAANVPLLDAAINNFTGEINASYVHSTGAMASDGGYFTNGGETSIAPNGNIATPGTGTFGGLLTAGNITTSGNGSFGGALTVTGEIDSSYVHSTGAMASDGGYFTNGGATSITPNGNIATPGTGTFGGLLTGGNGLTVTGAISFASGTFTISPTTGNLTSSGSATFGATLTVGGQILASGQIHTTSSVACDGGFITNGGNTLITGTGNITTTGAGSFGGNLGVTGNITTPGVGTFGAVSAGSPGINTTGGVTATVGFFTSGTKAFRIPHPLDDQKTLTHVSLEGPEIGVYYRGEGATIGGWAEITLPDYFEALTMKENRTVLLTALFEEDEEPIGSIAASRVKEGKFRVWSGLPTQKFYWEVKAVRQDIGPLEVEQDRAEGVESAKA